MKQFLLIGVVGCCLSSFAVAQSYRPGDKVVVIADTPLVVDGRNIVDRVSPGTVLKVEEINGSWLWVNRAKPGWLESRYVIPLDRRAIDRLTALIQSEPSSAQVYAGRGEVWQELGELDIAIADFNEAIRLSPEAGAYNYRGSAWCAKGEYDKAIADFDEALRLDPKNAIYFHNRGLARQQKGEDDKAAADYTQALALDSTYAMTYSNRGVIWLSKGEYDKAIADCDEALRLDPKLVNAYINRALAWVNKKDYDKAVADYDEALRLDPHNAQIYFGRGSAWKDQKEYDQAIADFDEAVRLDAKNASAFTSRGLAWNAKREFDKAIADFDRAIRLEPNNSFARKSRGLVWASKGNYDRAIADYDEAIRLTPDYAVVYEYRGFARSILGEYDKAVADYDAAVGVNPQLVWPRYGKAIVKFVRRDPTAVGAFQELIDARGWAAESSAYAALLGHIAAQLNGDTARAAKFLDDARGKLAAEWPEPCIRYLRGELDESGLMESATDLYRQTSAHCYVGLNQLAGGRADEARVHLTWVVEHGNRLAFEYLIAVSELKRLEAKPKPTAP